MAAVFLSAAAVCFASLFIGQAALRIAGAKEWSWLAPPVGLSLLMLAATPTFSIPGRTTTVAIVLAIAAIAAAVWCLRAPAHRPPLLGLTAVAPVVFLTMVPFLAYDRGGILGPTLDSDMAAHLSFVEAYVSAVADRVVPIPPDYPMGPHAIAALLTGGFGIPSYSAFSGFTMALPIITGYTALAAARRASWLGQAILSTLVGLPFLVAAYYGQGSFKEVGMAGLVLALTLYMAGFGPSLKRGRWVPPALLIGGIISIYSPAGLIWVVAVLGLWGVTRAVVAIRAGGLARAVELVRRQLPALAVGAAVLVAALLPQADRMYQFVALRNGGSDIETSNLGNLVGPLPGWEAFGVWGNPDYRFPNGDSLTVGLWIGFVVILVLVGTWWAWRRRLWIIPLVAGAALLIWALSEGGQSPYVTAKALVIASPLLLLVAALPLVDRYDRARGRWLWLLAPLVGLVLLFRVGTDDLRTLRYVPVGATSHTDQIESFRPLLAGHTTLYLGSDEFIRWQLSGVPVVGAATVTEPGVVMRKGKWEPGWPMDLDTVPAWVLNGYEYVLAFREPGASEPPPSLEQVAATEDFVVYKRVGKVLERSILDEGEWPGAILDCKSPSGAKILAAGGVAAVRSKPILLQKTAVKAGEGALLDLDLPPGSWELKGSYQSPYPIRLQGPGLDSEVPANLEREGPRLPLGRVKAGKDGVTISLIAGDSWLAPSNAAAYVGPLVATRPGEKDRVVPIAEACGRYVDWYVPAASS